MAADRCLAMLCFIVGCCLMAIVGAIPLDRQAGVVVPKKPKDGHFYLSYLDSKGRSADRSVVRPDLFLIQFGYASQWNTSRLRQGIRSGRSIGLQGKEFRDAIKAYQIQNDLPVTGEADEKTLRWMKRPRCGVSDVRRGRFAVTPNKWENLTLTYNYVRHSDHLSQDMVTLAISRAFSYWEQVSSLRFIRIDDGEQANLRFGFYRGYHNDGAINSFDGPNGKIAHAFYPPTGDIHFDDSEHFTEGTRVGKNLRLVAAHEIGHALGLDHSWLQGALMYPGYKGFIPHEEFSLHADDIAGIQHMYGTPRRRRDIRRPPGNLNLGNRKHFADRFKIHLPTFGSTTLSIFQSLFTLTTTTVTPPTHRRTFSPMTLPMWPKPTPGKGEPSPCKAKIDSAFLWHDGAKYFLRGSLLYRQGPGPSSMLSFDFPRSVRRYLTDAPKRTDAAVYSPYSAKLYLFSGRHIFVYDRFGYIRSRYEVTDPNFPVNMDAAFINHKGTVCLIQNDMLYEFDEWRRVVDKFSSLSAVYKGLPVGIDAVINDSHWVPEYEYLYFFKGSQYYKVDIHTKRVVYGYPKDIGGPWFGCATWTVPK